MQLAFEANLDKAQVSRTTKLLVERGLVSKLPCPEDGRCVQLTLTAQGRSCCEQVMPLIQQRNQALLQCLSESEQASLLEMFDRMLEQARQQIRSDRPGD
jgi:DNA-binding MarR family transcriptional regulator